MPYSGNPNSSPTDAVRFWLEDTSATPLLSDDEIQYLIQISDGYAHRDPILVASVAVSAIMAKYIDGNESISGDGISMSQGDLAAKYSTFAEKLRETYNRLNGALALPIAGGGCVPVFELGQFDNYEAGPQLSRAEEWARIVGEHGDYYQGGP